MEPNSHQSARSKGDTASAIFGTRKLKPGHSVSWMKNEDGSVLTFWGVSIAVFMGLLALTFDIGRMSATQSQLQSYADNVALAAAGELDGNDDAIDRAGAAANNMIQGFQTFGTGGNALGGGVDITLTYFEGLPGNDTSPLDPLVTTDPNDARYVRVDVDNKTINLGFGAAFAALSGASQIDNSVGAEAVAGLSLSGCDITPMMFCLPSGDYKADENIGDTILLRAGGGTNAWGPGAFGWIDPSGNLIDEDGPCSGLTSANLDRCLIGAVAQRTACFDSRGINIASGQKVGIFEPALNVRFDIYEGAMQSKKNNPDYAPAPNVIKGIVPGNGQCINGNVAISPDSLGLPADDCFASGTCLRYGNGDWSGGRQDYVDANYGGTDPHPTATTRYSYYQAEINGAGGGGANQQILSGLSETGRPQCSNKQSPDPGRRVLVAAGVDCNANGVGGGNKTNIKVQEFFEIFMLQPVGYDGTKDVWVEIVGSAGGGGGGNSSNSIIRDVVQLYR